MSEENVRIVERAYEALRMRGFAGMSEFLDREVVWEDLAELPGAGTYRGHDGVREAFRRFLEVWGELESSAEQIIDAGDAVVVAHRWRGTGASSGTPIDAVRWNVFTLREGKIVHRRVFRSREAALAAAGGSE